MKSVLFSSHLQACIVLKISLHRNDLNGGKEELDVREKESSSLFGCVSKLRFFFLTSFTFEVS
jgi:hypothetical protein